jgi:hypothetical protein
LNIVPEFKRLGRVASFPSSGDCESINHFKQMFVACATIFKPVILAWMPESSAKEGNCIIINNIILQTISHPCDWIPASMLE